MYLEENPVGKSPRAALAGALVAAVAMVLLFALLASDAAAELIHLEPAPVIVPTAASPAKTLQVAPSAPAAGGSSASQVAPSAPAAGGSSSEPTSSESTTSEPASGESPQPYKWDTLTGEEPRYNIRGGWEFGKVVDDYTYEVVEMLRLDFPGWAEVLVGTDDDVKQLIANAQRVQDSIKQLITDIRNPAWNPASNPVTTPDDGNPAPEQVGAPGSNPVTIPDAGNSAPEQVDGAPGSDAGQGAGSGPQGPDGGNGGGGKNPDSDDPNAAEN
ncbi:MAG TPA: hypothetical protein VHI77_01055 [Solirubrobacterales bacterium]|jgi:hypothetical protein|nr:hypothetical protein [Solirubrobacterales bacterium]